MSVNIPSKMHPGVEEALKKWGIEDLYPPQEESLDPIAAGENLVVCVPTAAGKTLIAYMAILNKVLRRKKALYVVPLRALASEKFQELRSLESMGVKVALSYGDYDDADRYLERYDVVIATSEKADSLLRHRTRWMRDIGVIISDEVHLLNDKGRGPTLEVILTRFKQINPDAQMICLSATVSNGEEMANWLDARLVTSDFRPVELKTGILCGSEIIYSDLSKAWIEPITGDPVMDISLDSATNSEDGLGQILVFVNTRKSTESLALKLSRELYSRTDELTKRELYGISEGLGRSETRIVKRLRRAIRGGAAFHHAGLSNEQRGAVEDAFKSRKIKVLFATPTLAAGINLPARRVLVRDWTRFEPFNPHSPIPVLEVQQMMGRAGRPSYDKTGEAFVLARKEKQVDRLMETYLWGKPEEVLSKLGSLPALRMHLLSSFATNYVRDIDEMWDFLGNTFYAYQNDTWKIEGDVEEILDFLEEEGFIRRDGGNVEATDLGKRVARLYIDPLSAVTLKRALNAKPKKLSSFSILHAISSTTDIHPLFVRARDRDWVLETLYGREGELLLEIPTEKAEYDWFLGTIKTALFFSEWIGENREGEEASEERMETLFNTGPGDIRTKVEMANWMLYSMRELSRLFNSGRAQLIDEVSLRVENGVRKELLPLIRLKGVGRVRARRLYSSGLKDIDDIRKTSHQKLASVKGIGSKLAAQIKSEVEGGEPSPMEETEPGGPRQSNLGDFS